ncbi:Uncharacterised protein [Chlamydia trachomatis]|nr:Uncharacterised protein [Chlamydia trachomatis]
MSDTGNIQATRCNVRCYQYIKISIFEVAENTEAFVLVQVTMDTFRTEATDFQTTCQFVHTAFCTTKNDSQFWLVHIHETCHGVKFFTFTHTNIVLVYQVCRQFLSSNFNMLRLFHKLNPDTFNRIWHRCREEQRLTAFWHTADNSFDVFQEAHVEHFIRFIQNQGFDMVQT